MPVSGSVPVSVRSWALADVTCRNKPSNSDTNATSTISPVTRLSMRATYQPKEKRTLPDRVRTTSIVETTNAMKTQVVRLESLRSRSRAMTAATALVATMKGPMPSVFSRLKLPLFKMVGK